MASFVLNIHFIGLFHFTVTIFLSFESRQSFTPYGIFMLQNIIIRIAFRDLASALSLFFVKKFEISHFQVFLLEFSTI